MIGYHKKNFGIWSACIGFELRLWYNASGSGSWLKFSGIITALINYF